MGRTVITYGTFDLFHVGHQKLLEHAKALGDYLIVGITSDAFDRERGKFDVKQPLIDRIHAVEATGLADQIVVEEFKGQKIEDIKKYGVDVFTVGSDWVGKFDYLEEYCEVVYLPRTRGVSSTELRKASANNIVVSCIGEGSNTDRFKRECAAVSEVELSKTYPIDVIEGFSNGGQVETVSFAHVAQESDAVYVNVSASIRSKVVLEAIEAGLHVLCEGPIAYETETASHLIEIAHEKQLVLIEALAVMYQPGFQRLRLLLESGVIGEIKDIDCAYSLIPDGLNKNDRFNGSFYSMSSRALLPALAFLGSKPLKADILAGYERDFCNWSKFNLLYETASATIRVGRGVKTEGDMTITGTSGYIYIPAPWWFLEYFEIRGEDLRNTKKHYYESAGEGHRYLIKEFYNYCSDYEYYAAEEQELHDIEMTTVTLVERLSRDDCNQLENHSKRFGGGETV